MTRGRRLSFTATRLAGLLLAVNCATNPVTGRRELALISEAQEIQMGREGSADVKASLGLHPDAALQTYVNTMGRSLAATTERPELPWEFSVIDDASVNAFALPGGFIFVSRGLLTHMTSEAELASVLGHEAGHVTARHSVQQMSQQQLMTLGLGLGSVLSPVIAKYGQIAGAGVQLMMLKNSRDDETQADALGFRYAIGKGYDTRAMISLFAMLERDRQSSGGGRLPEWQSTHPDPGNRAARVEQMVAASTVPLAGLTLGEDAFLKRIDGLIYGVDPRAGFFRGTLFLHPDLAFSLRFPDGWRTQNAADAVTAMSAAEDAVIELRAAKGSAAEAAQAFLAQEGLQAGPPTARTINGNRAVTGEFTAGNEGAPVRGTVTFIEYAGATWAITAYAVAAKYESYAPSIGRTVDSFQRLTDATALAVQPQRVRVDVVPRAMSLQQFNAALPSSIPLAELAMINGLTESSMLRAGQSIKRVIGTPLP